jgi:hypothetical protein
MDGAIVIVDDLGMHNMNEFWNTVPYEKVPIECGTAQGVFRYDRGVLYTASFPRGQTSMFGEER